MTKDMENQSESCQSSNENESAIKPTKPFYVAEVLNKSTVVVNAGENEGVKERMRCTVYARGQEIFDPISHESLGYLELLRGKGIVTQVQPNMCVVRACKFRLPNVWFSTVRALSERFEDDDYIFSDFDEETLIGDVVKFL